MPTAENRKSVSELLGALIEAADGGASSPEFMRKVRASKNELAGIYWDSIGSEPAAQLLALKTLNLLLARRDFFHRAQRAIASPFGLVVEPSNGCNLACPGCVHSENARQRNVFDWSPGMVKADLMRDFLDQYGPYATHIFLYDYGEPLLNPRTPQYVGWAKDSLALTTISSNLSIKKLDAEAIVESGLDYLTVSVDGATQDVYQVYRRGGDLGLVLKNMAAIADAKRRLHRNTPVIQWQFLVFEHNEHQIEPAIEMAKRHGANQILIASPFDVAWDDPTIRVGTRKSHEVVVFDFKDSYLEENRQRFVDSVDKERVRRFFEDAWSNDGVAISSEESQSKGADITCHWLYKNVAMDATGRVMPCCGPPGKDYDLVLGTFKANSGSQDIFNTPKYRAARLGCKIEDEHGSGTEGVALEGLPHCLAGCTWGKGRDDVISKPEHSVAMITEATGEVLDPDVCSWLGDW